MSQKRFNIRVYGIVINDDSQLLVSDELVKGEKFTKFPGGGLEWGEGTRDCLKREFMEELNQEIEVLEHFYTTDYFQKSAYKDEDQLISIYYKVKLVGEVNFKAKTIPFDFPENVGSEYEVQRWVPLNSIYIEDFRWPVDRIVATKLITTEIEKY